MSGNVRNTLLVLYCVTGSIPIPASADDRVTGPAPVTFAAYGDMPYNRKEEQVLAEDIAPRIRDGADVPFVIHVGDIGRPEVDACTDEKLQATRDFFEHDLVKPVFYTPGDNEWTDCDRAEAGGKSELGRLDAVRRIFFNDRMPLDAAWRYEQQTGQPENQIWQYRGVRFVTLHVVGTNDGSTDIRADDPELAQEKVVQRERNNRIWLDHAFSLANDNDTQALVVAIQADPFGEPDGKYGPFSRCTRNAAYGEFCSHLLLLSSSLGKPVLLIHGDTNPYCLDQPIVRNFAPLLWRLNTPGDYYQDVDAALVSFNPGDHEHPFSVSGLLSGSPAPTVCGYH